MVGSSAIKRDYEAKKKWLTFLEANSEERRD
jgi:hypothetical protein